VEPVDWANAMLGMTSALVAQSSVVIFMSAVPRWQNRLPEQPL
jgi:hypothetical protein